MIRRPLFALCLRAALRLAAGLTSRELKDALHTAGKLSRGEAIKAAAWLNVRNDNQRKEPT